MPTIDEVLLTHVGDKHSDNPKQDCRVCQSRLKLDAMSEDQLIVRLKLLEPGFELTGEAETLSKDQLVGGIMLLERGMERAKELHHGKER